MKLTYDMLPTLKQQILNIRREIEVLKLAPPTAENLARVKSLTTDAQCIARSLRELRGHAAEFAA